jgi:hypothetical protein
MHARTLPRAVPTYGRTVSTLTWQPRILANRGRPGGVEGAKLLNVPSWNQGRKLYEKNKNPERE